MSGLNTKDLEMLQKITEIIKDSDFEMRNVFFNETCDHDKTTEYKTRLEFNLVRK